MTDRITLDSNILVYFVDAFDAGKHASAEALVELSARSRCKLGLQAIGEFYRASTRKLKLPPSFVLGRVDEFLTAFETFPHTRTALARGANEAANGRFSIWDAVLLVSAEEAGCTLMLSEDMHDGAQLGNIVVRNPFGAKGLSDAAKAALGV